WSTTVLLNILAVVLGPQHAEQGLASFCVVSGFFGFAYFCRSLDPRVSGWSPVLNFLLCPVFIWMGFYNFYLGMALFAFATGYYLRHRETLNPYRALVLAGWLAILFFTHVLSLALALITIACVAVWARIATLLTGMRDRPPERHA